MSHPTLLDLFCGAGGMSHGFTQAGFQSIAGLDHDRDALDTYQYNHPQSTVLEVDLSEVEPSYISNELSIQSGDVDCIIGGPPCQGFSRNRAYRHREGAFVDDARNYLYKSFFKYIKSFAPKVVVLENVPEILVKKEGTFREAIEEGFHEQEYNLTSGILLASEYGTPQFRRRAIFIAVRNDLFCRNGAIEMPKPLSRTAKRPDKRTPVSKSKPQQLVLDDTLLPLSPTVWDAISDLQGAYATDLHNCVSYASDPSTVYQAERRDQNTIVYNHYPWSLSDRQLQRIRLLKEGEGQLHLPLELRTKNGYGSAYRRLQSDAVALTITTWMFHPGSGMFTHPFEDRVVTIREAARLQGFQDSFRFLGNYHSQCRQVGNAVPPILARCIAQSILEYLKS